MEPSGPSETIGKSLMGEISRKLSFKIDQFLKKNQLDILEKKVCVCERKDSSYSLINHCVQKRLILGHFRAEFV